MLNTIILFLSLIGNSIQEMLICRSGGNLTGTLGARQPTGTNFRAYTSLGVGTSACLPTPPAALNARSDDVFIVTCQGCLNCNLTSLPVGANYLLVLTAAQAKLYDGSLFPHPTFTLTESYGNPTPESVDSCQLVDSSGDSQSTDALRSFSKTSVLFVSISFIILMVISLAWLVFYYVQRFRYAHAKDRLQRRLFNAAKKALARIPTRTIKVGDCEMDTDCPVCIDPYAAGDVVRTLPCRHIFHKTCIDPWLLEHRTCPMCKGDILKAFGYQVTCSGEGSRGEEREGGARDVESPDPPSVASESGTFSYPPAMDAHDPFSFSPSSSPQLVLNNSNAKSFVVPLTVHSKPTSASSREVIIEPLPVVVAPERRGERAVSAGDPGPSSRAGVRTTSQGQIVNLVHVRSRSASVARAATFRGRMGGASGLETAVLEATPTVESPPIFDLTATKIAAPSTSGSLAHKLRSDSTESI